MIKEAYIAGQEAALEKIARSALRKITTNSKLRELVAPTLEIAGLGMLLAPHVGEATGHKFKKSTINKLEMAGLSTLMLPSAKHIKNTLFKKIKPIK